MSGKTLIEALEDVRVADGNTGIAVPSKDPEDRRPRYFLGFNGGIDFAIVTLTGACTPRKPQPEWFGTGPGQWDAWWIRTTTPRTSPRVVYGVGQRIQHGEIVLSLSEDDSRIPFRVIIECLPVLREGYGPVGWQVVET